MFITFEGMEGCGKTTQAKALVEYLNTLNKKAIFTREPGGTELAERIRELVLNGQGINDPLTEFLLLSAARNDHVKNLIKPALSNGQIVVCDRFIDSSFAYQSYAKGLDKLIMLNIHNEIFGDFTPDITFLIDVDVNCAKQRIAKNRKNNYYDDKDINFYNKIRLGFLEGAKSNLNRIYIIDGNQSIEGISNQIHNKLKILI